MNSAESRTLTLSVSSEQENKEKTVRAWIARKESVCPYAPGLARFVHLPHIDTLSMRHVQYFADELQRFYDARDNGKRVGRWMLMPEQEWTSHEEAHRYSERLFWLLNASYYFLINDARSVQKALNQSLPGYNRGYKGEILNPIVGHLPNPDKKIVPAKSLFYSALSPLYRSQQFYRYCPHSIIPLVYAAEFQDLKNRNPSVSERVAFEMACGGLYERFGDELCIDQDLLKNELPVWGLIIDRIAEVMRAKTQGLCSRSETVKGCPASNLSYFRLCNDHWVDSFYCKYSSHLNVLSDLLRQTGATPKQIISACFAGSGLYTLPDYL